MVHSKCFLKQSPSSQPFSCAMAALAPITNLQCAEFWHNKYWWEERASLEALAKRFRPGLILRRRVPWQQCPRTRRLGLFLWPICWMPNTWCFVKIKLLKVAFFSRAHRHLRNLIHNTIHVHVWAEEADAQIGHYEATSCQGVAREDMFWNSLFESVLSRLRKWARFSFLQLRYLMFFLLRRCSEGEEG